MVEASRFPSQHTDEEDGRRVQNLCTVLEAVMPRKLWRYESEVRDIGPG